MLMMSGLDFVAAPLEIREMLSFSGERATSILQTICASNTVLGGALISTCNRTEIYLSAASEDCDPARLLCHAAGVPYSDFHRYMYRLQERQLKQHLFQLAAGLKSQIFGEDQIITQVRNAITHSRDSGCSDPLTETLFRTAVTAGKEVKSKVQISSAPLSAASVAADKIAEIMGELKDVKTLVIGNGEMGRLAARLMQQQGAEVTVTLRTYRHGETIVPAGCGVIPYDDRYIAALDSDIVISATTSPHHTISFEGLTKLKRLPKILCDLAIPRDIEPETANLPGITLLNIDTIGGGHGVHEIPPEANLIIEEYIDRFIQWRAYRDCIPALQELKDALFVRFDAIDELSSAQLRAAVSKSVELMAGGLKNSITKESIIELTAKVRANTRVRNRSILETSAL
jgi:glutamyl-tRNA reductase